MSYIKISLKKNNFPILVHNDITNPYYISVPVDQDFGNKTNFSRFTT